MRNFIYRILLPVFLIVIINAAAVAAPCSINGASDRQYIRGFGASSAWSDWGGNSADNAWLVEHADEFFTTTNGIGLTIIRARINPDTGQWGGTVPPLQAARDLGATEILATAWTPPAAWKSNGAVDNQDGAYLLPEYYDEYADYLRDYVVYMRDTHSVNITAISPANEPDYRVGYDGCSWTGGQLRDFVKNNLGPVFAAAGLTTKIIIGESFANDCAYVNPSVQDPASRSYLFAGAAHFYGGGPYDCAELSTYGKEFWQTEKSNFTDYDGTMTHGLITAEWVHSGFVTGNYNVFLYWWLASDQTNEGLMSETMGIPKRYYTFGNYSKFIRPGYYRIDATAVPASNVLVSAYRSGDSSNHVIVAINRNSSSVSQTFTLSNVSSSAFIPYITSSSLNLAAQAQVNVSAGSFTYTLPAQSVVSFVGLGGPTATHTPYAGTPTFTATNTPTPSSFLLDDMEDGNNTNNLGGGWYSYSGEGTTITPRPFTMTAGDGVPGSTAYSARIYGTVSDYAGMGTNLDAGEAAVDLSSYTGIEFWVKGNGSSYWVQFTQPSITGGDFYGKAFTTSGTWTKVTVLFTELATRWGETAAFTQDAIAAIQWTTNSNGDFDFRVDDVNLILAAGENTPTPQHSPTGTRTTLITATYTATRTFTGTRTNTPSYTSTNTFTLTRTPTRTATRTATRTNTGTPTDTYTQTDTPSEIPTATYSPTKIPTHTRTFSATLTDTGTPEDVPTLTVTPSFSPTHSTSQTPLSTNTRTFTGTPSDTATDTATNTPTGTNTATRTATLSITPTVTFTYTFSPTATPTITDTYSSNTFTATPTATPTAENTDTYTATLTATDTQPDTFTPTYTATDTHVTNTYTATETGTILEETPTFTPTADISLSSTVTPTQTESYTQSPTFTATGTPSFTFTLTFTPSVTLTPTFTQTATLTVVPETPTFTRTATLTFTPSMTMTFTFTATPSTTQTPAATYTVTPTPEPTAVPTETELVIDKVITGPNPVNPVNNPDMLLRFRITQNCVNVEMSLYSAAMRLVRRIDVPGNIPAGERNVYISTTQLSGLANGIYFYTVTAESDAGEKARAEEIGKIIILK